MNALRLPWRDCAASETREHHLGHALDPGSSRGKFAPRHAASYKQRTTLWLGKHGPVWHAAGPGRDTSVVFALMAKALYIHPDT